MNAPAILERPLDIAPLRGFVTAFADLLAATRDEQAILESGGALLARLIARDDWLPEAFARPNPERYQQYLLHCDSRERFSVVSFVWGPGQSTPVHDHQVWGLVGVLRGVEKVERFARAPTGALIGGEAEYLREGEVDAVSPRIGDIHRVSNAREDAPSVSIHVYGANIGAVERATYAADGTPKPFISGYANSVIPNLWDRSKHP
jgi:predicted metal-dependent enzyme (double-stranded beta helix superfamily)